MTGITLKVVFYNFHTSRKEIFNWFCFFGLKSCPVSHCFEPTRRGLLTPCRCKGSCAYIHNHCLEKWFNAPGKASCEICKYDYRVNRLGYKNVTEMTLPCAYSDDPEEIIDFVCMIGWILFLFALLLQCSSSGYIITFVAFAINTIYYSEILFYAYERWHLVNSSYKWVDYKQKMNRNLHTEPITEKLH
uniref:RING-CH-type domain-containing protein n=1 Tax=Rhabditophanes sp. KR3021 TaxID=114890 RepID=A0AC35TQ96_9BILA